MRSLTGLIPAVQPERRMAERGGGSIGRLHAPKTEDRGVFFPPGCRARSEYGSWELRRIEGGGPFLEQNFLGFVVDLLRVLG